MTVRVERDFVVDASPDAIWEFLEDPSNRARAINLVDRFETDGETTIWHLELPLPGIRQTLAISTKSLDRRPPEFISFEGRSAVFDVTGAHEIETSEDGTTVHNRFEVSGRVPGVESFFKRRFEGEIDNLETQLIGYLQQR